MTPEHPQLSFERVVFTRAEERLDADYQVIAQTEGVENLAPAHVVTGFFTNLIGQADTLELERFQSTPPAASYLFAPLHRAAAPDVYAFGCVRVSPRADRHGRTGILNFHLLVATRTTWEALDGDPFRLLDCEARGVTVAARELDRVFPMVESESDGSRLYPLKVSHEHVRTMPGYAWAPAEPPEPPAALGPHEIVAADCASLLTPYATLLLALGPTGTPGLARLIRHVHLALPRHARFEYAMLTHAFTPTVTLGRFHLVGASAEILEVGGAPWRSLSGGAPASAGPEAVVLHRYQASRATAAALDSHPIGAQGGAAASAPYAARGAAGSPARVEMSGGNQGVVISIVFALILAAVVFALASPCTPDSPATWNGNDNRLANNGTTNDRVGNIANAHQTGTHPPGNNTQSNDPPDNNSNATANTNEFAHLASEADLTRAWLDLDYINAIRRPLTVEQRRRLNRFCERLFDVVDKEHQDEGRWSDALRALVLQASLVRWLADGRDSADLQARVWLRFSPLDFGADWELDLAFTVSGDTEASRSSMTLPCASATDRELPAPVRIDTPLRMEAAGELRLRGTQLTVLRVTGSWTGSRDMTALDLLLVPPSLDLKGRRIDGRVLTARLDVARLAIEPVTPPLGADGARYRFPALYTTVGPLVYPE